MIFLSNNDYQFYSNRYGSKNVLYHRSLAAALSQSKFRPIYAVDGCVTLIRACIQANTPPHLLISQRRMEMYSVQYQLDVAIEKMLKNTK